MKITETTTLAELQLFAELRGVTHITARAMPAGVRVALMCYDATTEYGSGETLVQATADAFDKLSTSLAMGLVQP